MKRSREARMARIRIVESGRATIQLVEQALYDDDVDNPLAKSRFANTKNRHIRAARGFDKPLNKMAVPYGSYSVARNIYATGSPTVTDRRNG